MPPQPPKGRVEAGLERDLIEHREIGPSERAALRSQAHAIDVAEGQRDPDAVSRANAVYLELRRQAGLTGAAPAADSFALLMEELGRPTTTAPGDAAHP